jgi:hypothetical protein
MAQRMVICDIQIETLQVCTCRGCLVTSVAARGAGWVKMATRAEKAFCVFEYPRTQSIVTVRRRFRTKLGKDPPVKNSIPTWRVPVYRKRPGRHAAAGMGGNGLSAWRLSRHKVRTHRACMRYAKQTWRASLSIDMSHVTILCAIEVYQLFVMCQGIMNNPVFFPFTLLCLNS